MSDKPLTLTERGRLSILEKQIETGQAAYIEVGKALAEINQKRLYRAGYKSFATYLAKRWPKIKKSRAYQLVAAAKVAETVHHGGQEPPTNERQARALGKAPEAIQGEVLGAARAIDGEPSASRIEELTAKALEGKTPEEQLQAVNNYEKKEIERAEQRREVRHNADRREWVDQAENLIRRAKKLYVRFGPDSQGITDKLDEALQLSASLVLDDQPPPEEAQAA